LLSGVPQTCTVRNLDRNAPRSVFRGIQPRPPRTGGPEEVDAYNDRGRKIRKLAETFNEPDKEVD